MEWLAILLLLPPLAPQEAAAYLDLAPFGAAISGPGWAGVEWREERDISTLRVRWARRPASVRVEYWHRTWPYPPPEMPTIEDPVDDPWQGKWLPAASVEICREQNCEYRFEPLADRENPRAANLPGVRYRRTLKIRLLGEGGNPAEPLRVFSESVERTVQVRISFERPTDISGVAVFNGRERKLVRERNGGLLEVVASRPAPAGSNDVTVVTVRTGRQTFSFSVEDLKRGPMRLPAYGVVITDLAHPRADAPSGRRIREMLAREPEQTYERAAREIPALDPWDRQRGDRVYLPLAADASWQKFAVEYGGNVFISKRGAKAKGRELARLRWEGDRLTWTIGTGSKPYYREDRKAAVSTLDGDLPVVIQRWECEGLRYTEEAFATLLRGPLSPLDAARGEETPAVLMLRLTVENPGRQAVPAHIWLGTAPAEPLRVAASRVLAPAGPRVVVDAPGAAVREGKVHLAVNVPAGEARSVVVKLPFVSDLEEPDLQELEGLDYERERTRVVVYWRQVVNSTVRIRVPEPKFNQLLGAVMQHMRISATKDPKSSLFMVPAAAYGYQVFANETCFQTLLLDAMGDHATARHYLETLLRLQGSRNFPGLHQGPPDAIFHGARVDAEYDYTAHHYGLDHGTVLWALAEHFLFTRDHEWLGHAWPHMRKAIEWIAGQRAATPNRLLPAGHLEDNSDWAQWFSVNAFAWAGLDRTARALAWVKHADAGRLRAEADAYRTDLRAAVQRAWELAPVTRLRDGTYAPYVPVQPEQRFRLFGPLRTAYYTRYGKPGVLPNFRLSATREVLYGPMILLSLGVFAAEEPIADWILDDWEDNLTLTSGLGLNVHGLTDDRYWFSQGGMVFQANLQNPILAYLKRHEVPAAIRNLYNSFAACLYPEVNAFTEEYRMWSKASGPFYKTPDEAKFATRLRDMLLLEDGDTLWLAGGVPRRWLESKEGIRVAEAASHFGPVSYTLKAGAAAGTVEAEVHMPARNPPHRAWLVARTPRPLREVTVNGQPWTRIDRAREAIELPLSGVAQVTIRY